MATTITKTNAQRPEDLASWVQPGSHVAWEMPYGTVVVRIAHVDQRTVEYVDAFGCSVMWAGSNPMRDTRPATDSEIADYQRSIAS